jgi:hypothetical protein
LIALISFKNELIITREEANKLQLQYHECNRIGINSYGKLENMNSYYHYRDELEHKEDDKYYKDGKEISSYYICERPKNNLDWVIPEQNNQLVDLDSFITKCTYPFYIERCVKTAEPSVANIQSLLYQVEQKTTEINKTIDIMKQQTFNQRVNVHVGGGLITTYNELKLKEDSCTDELQRELNDGWRIVAVCVQPDQRRPDYILGRFNPNLDVTENDSAKR